MMMVHDSTPVPPSISAESVSALREALASYLLASTDNELRPALRRFAQEAKEKNITAEQLLIVLKQVWYALPQLRDVLSPDRRVQLLQRIVSISIREYYDP